eukprot:2676484-Ditylum_brightwellii.AAC.1
MDTVAIAKFSGPDPGGKRHEDAGFVAMDLEILEAGVHPQFLTVPRPCLPALRCRQCFHASIWHCLPGRVDVMHHSSPD